MNREKRAKARQLRGNLEALRENTRGGDAEIVVLLHKIDDRTLEWIGKSPRHKRRKK